MNASSSPWTPTPLLRRLIFLALLFCLLGGNAFAQAAGSDYTASLPSVQKVETQLQGSDPSDTTARQVAVFEYLQAYIQRIRDARQYNGPYTPGELKLLTDYAKAQYDLTQSFTKTHTPDEVKVFQQKEGRYSVNNALDWIHQLSGAQSNAAYHNAETGLAQSYNQHEAQLQQQMKQSWGGSNGQGANGMRNDAGSVAVRRCLELGGSQLQCLGKGMSTGVLDLFGMSHSPLFQGSSFTGLTLTGQFKNGNGIELDFSDGTISLNHCGKLVPDAHAYTLQRNGSQILIHVNNSPAPFSVALGSDGKLRGPASAEISGKIITGYRRVWVANPVTPGHYETHTQTSHEEMTPLEAQQYAGNSNLTYVGGGSYDMATTTTSSTYVPGTGGGGHYESVPIYAPRTQACSIGTLMPGPPTAVDPGTLTDIANVAGMLFGQPSSGAGNARQEMISPGIRLAGVYTSRGGLKAQFADAAVVLDCGEAHVRDKYTVEQDGSRVLVHVQNPASPFTVMVQPDGSLAGPASVTVNGRLVTGMNGNDVTFTPHSETCNLGTFSPATSASSSFVATSPVAPPRPVSPSPVAATATPSSLTLAITTSFPIARNPLAGRPVALMSARYDIALRAVGAPVPANFTPGKALQAYIWPTAVRRRVALPTLPPCTPTSWAKPPSTAAARPPSLPRFRPELTTSSAQRPEPKAPSSGTHPSPSSPVITPSSLPPPTPRSYPIRDLRNPMIQNAAKAGCALDNCCQPPERSGLGRNRGC